MLVVVSHFGGFGMVCIDAESCWPWWIFFFLSIQRVCLLSSHLIWFWFWCVPLPLAFTHVCV